MFPIHSIHFILYYVKLHLTTFVKANDDDADDDDYGRNFLGAKRPEAN